MDEVPGLAQPGDTSYRTELPDESRLCLRVAAYCGKQFVLAVYRVCPPPGATAF